MAVAKKKTAPKKKVVAEKKTGEKYASKAAMMKHEKGESKKMRMMEGEIPMAKKGGKTVKKYADGGKKPLSTSRVKKPLPTPRFKNPVKATQDSTQYYEDKYEHFRQAESNLKSVDPKNAAVAKEMWNQAADDRNRQKRKAVPGFDNNGFPVQYKKGGKTAVKKKITTYKKGGKKC